MADIVLINPRFEVSYWGLEYTAEIMGKSASQPVNNLPLLAALTPAGHQVTILDENVAALNYGRLSRADIVGITGMCVQWLQMRQILERLKDLNVFTVVGGAWASVKEDDFVDLTDVIFVGEADETWPRFIKEWENKQYHSRYEQDEKTDMTRLPTPRYDLIDMNKYLFANVQFSRGCPFNCEFCDIIVTFGRRPRLKTPEQLILEIEAIHKAKINAVFIVDDNLIANKKEVKTLLQCLADWQRARGFPFIFLTQASLDLAEEEETMRLMVEANIQSVFIGIESPNVESLIETGKFQNTLSQKGTIVERVYKIQNAGLDVWAGMILGFDHDDVSIFDKHIDFLYQARILHSNTGMLSAIPKTPLYERLKKEKRLDLSDKCEFATNIIPKNMTRKELQDGYINLMNKLYEPNAYFKRLDTLLLDKNFRVGPWAKYRSKYPWKWFKSRISLIIHMLYIYINLMIKVKEPSLRNEYHRRAKNAIFTKTDLDILYPYLLKCAMHYHHHRMTTQMMKDESSVVNTF